MSTPVVILLWALWLVAIGVWGYFATTWFLEHRAMRRWIDSYIAYTRGERPDIPSMDGLAERYKKLISKAAEDVSTARMGEHS